MNYSYQNVLTEDRQRANRIILIWMNVLAGFILLIWMLGLSSLLNFSRGSSTLYIYTMPISAGILLLPRFLDLVFHLSDLQNVKQNGKLLAWINISFINTSILLLSATQPEYFTLAWFLPLIVACQYNSRKMTLISYFTGICCVILTNISFTNIGNSLLHIFPTLTVYVLSLPLVYSITKRSEILLKKQRLVIMAHQAKKSLDELGEFPDTFESDCRIKARYLVKNGIDVDLALSNMDNNIEKYNDFVLTFIGESKRKKEELYNLLDSDTLLQYGAKVHALRIKANALGLANLTDTAFFHEMEAYAGNEQIVWANWEKLSCEWDDANELFSCYIKSIGLRNHAYDKTGNQISFQEWGQQLNLAFDAIDSYDTIRAKNILNHLLQYQIDSDINQKLTTIVANIDDILKA